MAALFQSFRSSGMPKRLLRYALSRLELLDAEALDMENLDLALGRNTVFEFRDVGIKLKKLQKLLSLPPTFALEKAKVLLLRVTIPMDFYTSPILVEVEGVDVRIKVLGDAAKSARNTGAQNPEQPSVVPNTADLAQSFLQTEPISERKQLEDALAAETQDMGASVTMSEDGSEYESQVGTGQGLSLPGFLADFLQGIVDRVQVTIKNVTFQLDLEVPADLTSSKTESVSFQIVLGQIDVEGITSPSGEEDDPSSPIEHQEGKRRVALSNIRACLITEADAFAGLTRSPSTASPSMASSPALTRNPPSRQATLLSEGSFHDEPMASLQESFRERSSGDVEAAAAKDNVLSDSEVALGIPYDFSDMDQVFENDPEEDGGPSTPRASYLQDTDVLPQSASVFHSVIGSQSLQTERLETATTDLPVEQDALATSDIFSDPEQGKVSGSATSEAADAVGGEVMPSSSDDLSGSLQASTNDLAQSQLYTHDQAESMYMSAFSEAAAQPQDESLAKSRTEPPAPPPLTTSSEQDTQSGQLMPGAWDDSVASLPEPAVTSSSHQASPRHGEMDARPALDPDHADADSTASSPAFSRASLTEPVPARPFDPEVSDPIGDPISDTIAEDQSATPKGPPKLVKEIIQLDKIIISLPSPHHQHIQVQVDNPEALGRLAQSLGQSSIYPQAPGAFSVHSPASPEQQPSNPSSRTENGSVLEVSLSPVTVNFDASIAFLLAMAGERLLKATRKDTTQRTGHQDQTNESVTDSSPQMKLAVENISINFLNRLGGHINPSRSYADMRPFNYDQEVLLNLNLQGLVITSRSVLASNLSGSTLDARLGNQVGNLTKIDLQKFRFGYAKGDILSFDSAKQMSTSIRDTFLSSGTDIGIELVRIGDVTRTSVETLPLVVQIDLQRLDETFGWFGGLSSFLNMSASMTSNQPPMSKPAVAVAPAQKPRGVRFDTPIDPEDKSAKAQNKVNLRIGGALIELVGRDCSVAAETSALKVVNRDEGIGMSCSRLRISGPYLRNSMADPAITTEVGGLRIEFLMTPKDTDLEKLLELIIPSKVKFDHENDEVMVDTLLRQRRKGSVLRANVDTVNISVKNTSQLAALPALGDEIAKLAAVAKYLPEDDRPGLLTLTKVQKLSINCNLMDNIGNISCELRELEVGQITVPALVAVAVHGIHIRRNRNEELLSSDLFEGRVDAHRKGPVLMVRMIGDEIEPIIKLKLQDLRFEYRVHTIMDILGLGTDATPQDFEASLAASVANLGDQAQTALARPTRSPQGDKQSQSKPTILDVGLRDCVIGLNPYKLPSKLLVALTDAHVEAILPSKGKTKVTAAINKSSILLTDDIGQITTVATPSKISRPRSSVSKQVEELCARGFVDICYISSASAVAVVIPDPLSETKIEVEVRDDLLVLETCADSTQTLITLANALKPPTPPAKENKYRTKVLPVQDLLASISAEAFGRPEGEYDFDQDFAGAQELAGSGSEEDFGSDKLMPPDSQFFGSRSTGEELFDATKSMELSQDATMEDTNEGVLLTGFNPTQSEVSQQSSDDLVIHDDFYSPNASEEHHAKVWNSNSNTYDKAPSELVKHSPIKVSVRDVHVIWNLFDGYDWANTRQIITKAVEDVESRAVEHQSRRTGMQVYEEELEDEETIGDFLFNSIYIGVPPNRDPRDLSRAINEGLNDNATETESVATTTMTMNTNRTARRTHSSSRRLRLNRSKHHKITFELQGVNADLFMYPPDSGETVSSIDARVQNLDIFDHVPTSTWKKFATYDQDHGEREMGTSMVHLELLNVKPLPELAASEIVLRATVLPLRLHVDQDALDFITRFFEFKDDNVPVHSSPSDIPFLQRAEVHDIPVKLDFKPKRVDYGGLRSGHTTEFMNFIVLEESRMVLRHVIIYGVAGFDRLGKTLNDIWMPDVRTNQLPGVIAGLAPVRSLVNIGSGFRDLVEIPLREYRKDGRVIRSISKGAAAFARTTGTELVKLGAKLAIGTQYALQGAEEMLTEQKQPEMGWEDDDDLDPEDKKQISLYADQPTGVLQGIRGGFRSLTRDVNTARDAIIAVPGEVMAVQSASGAAKVMWKRAPTIVFRPAVGVTKAIGQTLLGATNALDQDNRRRIGEKYKH